MTADLLRRAAAKAREVAELPATFIAKLDRAGECWCWTSGLSTSGYGRYWDSGAFVQAHRFAYEVLVGEIPSGLVLDHLCRNRSCVNPTHLEPVTNAENVRRGLKGRMVVKCAQGHAYTPENTKIRKNGRRACRTCLRERRRKGNAPQSRTHCPAGHPYDADNTLLRAKGHRVCRACNQARNRAYRARLILGADS